MAENDHVEEDVQIRMESQTFYTDAASYWKAIPATVDGVMGGFANLSSNDISGSKKFLLPFLEASRPLWCLVYIYILTIDFRWYSQD
jgi:hypothetical protein